MHMLNTAELMNVWEQGRSQPPHRRALLLLAAAWPELRPEDLAGLSIGRRDARLLTLRERLFGPSMASMASCPECGEQLEIGFDVSDILLETGEEPPSRLSMELDGYEVLFRLPDSSDLAAMVQIGADRSMRRDILLKRCLTEVRLNGMEHGADELPPEISGAVTELMGRADPQADVKLSLDCPSCGNRWLAPFDILSYLWSEIESWGKRMLREVHILARAYGWREADIMNMSATRRQSYLEMLGA